MSDHGVSDSGSTRFDVAIVVFFPVRPNMSNARGVSLTAIASGYSETMYTRLLPAPRERSGDWLKLNAKQFGRLRACGRRRGRAAIRKEKRRPACLAW